MSADNYIVIYRKGERFHGVMGFASDEIDDDTLIRMQPAMFSVDTLGEAMGLTLQEPLLEYGYTLHPSVTPGEGGGEKR